MDTADDGGGATAADRVSLSGTSAFRSPWRRALLAGISIADLAVVASSLFGTETVNTIPAWLAVRGVLTGLAVLVVPAWSGGAYAGGEATRVTLATAAWCLTLPVFGAAIASVAMYAPSPPKAGGSETQWQRWPLPARWDDPALKIAPPTRQDAPETLAGDLTLIDRAHDGRRLRAVLLAARLPLRFQVPMARYALADPNDDVRLYAFSLIDRRRREHERVVQDARRTLERAASPTVRGHANLQLAEVAWEGAYHGLYEGTGLRESLVAALEHVDRSLALGVDDGNAHVLRGRVLLRLGDPDAADRALHRALNLGISPVRILPYLAEAAFRRGSFLEVRKHLGELKALERAGGAISGGLRSVMEHWV